MKVKKTDLPAILSQPMDDDTLPPISDDSDSSQEDDDDDEDEFDDEKEMMGDEPADIDDDDYDSDEETEDRDPIEDEDDDEDDDAFDSFTTPKKPSTTVPITAKTSTEAPVQSSSNPTVDPYFTHFDPRSEHQSYKVIPRVIEIIFIMKQLLSSCWFFVYFRMLSNV